MKEDKLNREECIVMARTLWRDIEKHEHGRYYSYAEFLKDNCKLKDPYEEFKRRKLTYDLPTMLEWMEGNCKHVHSWKEYARVHTEMSRELREELEEYLSLLKEYGPISGAEWEEIKDGYDPIEDVPLEKVLY